MPYFDQDQWPPGAKRYMPCFMLAEQRARQELERSFESRKLVRCDQAPSIQAAAAAVADSGGGSHRQENSGANEGAKQINGLDRFNMVCKCVRSGLCFTPHLFQLEFFSQIVQSMAESILGPHDWQRYGVALMERMGYTHNRKLCLASAPRRVGKTVILALVQVAVARYVPSVQITFSTGKRASDGLRNYVIKIMQNSGLGEYLQRAGQEELEILCIDGGDIVSIAKYFPANPDVRLVVRCCELCVVLNSTGSCKSQALFLNMKYKYVVEKHMHCHTLPYATTLMHNMYQCPEAMSTKKSCVASGS